MRIAYIAAGAGPMYCGACTRDATLARALIAAGHDVHLIPLYTPMKLERDDLPMDPIYFGGVNVYLQQALAPFRWLPKWLDRALDNPALLNWASRFGIQIEPKKLGPMTVSMLAGKNGHQKKEVDRLLHYLETSLKPEVVNLTNSLLSGLAPELKRRLNVPVLCTYQGEETFVNDLPEPHRTQARELIQKNAQSIDLVICPSAALAPSVAQFMAIDPKRLRVIRTAVEPAPEIQREPPAPFTVGFLSVIRPGKGLDLLVEAVRMLVQDQKKNLRLLIVGRIMNPPYWKDLHHRLQQNLPTHFEFLGELDEPAKAAFLRRCHIFSVPSRFAEPRGVAVLEALAAGLPVIVPNTGVFPELLALAPAGILVNPEDPPALAAAISRLMDDDAARNQMAHAALQLVLRHCSPEEMVARTVAAYEETVRRG